MNIISVQPITDRPIIDAIAPDDFMLIGDASDNNVVKRVLVSTLKNYFVASSPTPTPTPTPTGFALRVNCGGDDYVDVNGNIWLADFGFTGGNSSNPVSDPNAAPIANTLDDILYQSDRWQIIAYSIPVVSGTTYTINLLFREGYPPAFEVGHRVFNMKFNGQVVLDNFDIFAEAGGNTALIKTRTFIATSNILEIASQRILADPLLCAFEVLG